MRWRSLHSRLAIVSARMSSPQSWLERAYCAASADSVLHAVPAPVAVGTGIVGRADRAIDAVDVALEAEALVLSSGMEGSEASLATAFDLLDSMHAFQRDCFGASVVHFCHLARYICHLGLIEEAVE